MEIFLHFNQEYTMDGKPWKIICPSGEFIVDLLICSVPFQTVYNPEGAIKGRIKMEGSLEIKSDNQMVTAIIT